MFAGRLAIPAQSEIIFALQTFVHEPAELRLANRAMQIAMDIAQTIARLKISGGWCRNQLDENSNGTFVVIQMPFSNNPQSSQGLLNVIARDGDPVIVLIWENKNKPIKRY
jgi:hypothetical protein